MGTASSKRFGRSTKQGLKWVLSSSCLESADEKPQTREEVARGGYLTLSCPSKTDSRQHLKEN